MPQIEATACMLPAINLVWLVPFWMVAALGIAMLMGNDQETLGGIVLLLAILFTGALVGVVLWSNVSMTVTWGAHT